MTSKRTTRKKQADRPPKIQPWPNSTFSIKTQWEDWESDKHFWVHLERRAPGKYGSLQAMHAIVPSKRKDKNDSLIGSAKYRKITLDGARKLFQQAGVPEQQAIDFMEEISSQYPYPTADELFLEPIDSPFLALALGNRHKDLSYYRTGVPELTPEDAQLIETSLKELVARKPSSEELKKLLGVIF